VAAYHVVWECVVAAVARCASCDAKKEIAGRYQKHDFVLRHLVLPTAAFEILV